MNTKNPGDVADSVWRRQEKEAMSFQQQKEELADAVDALLAQDINGAEEAAMLEQAQRLVHEALNNSSAGHQ